MASSVTIWNKFLIVTCKNCEVLIIDTGTKSCKEDTKVDDNDEDWEEDKAANSSSKAEFLTGGEWRLVGAKLESATANRKVIISICI